MHGPAISRTPGSHAIALVAVSVALAITACGSSGRPGRVTAPGSAAQASAYIYWASNNTIGRANLNGTGVRQHPESAEVMLRPWGRCQASRAA